MAKSHVTVTLDVKNLDRLRMLGWELMVLRDEMVVMASPHAERLDAILGRWLEGDDDDDRPEVEP